MLRIFLKVDRYCSRTHLFDSQFFDWQLPTQFFSSHSFNQCEKATLYLAKKFYRQKTLQILILNRNHTANEENEFSSRTKNRNRCMKNSRVHQTCNVFICMSFIIVSSLYCVLFYFWPRSITRGQTIIIFSDSISPRGNGKFFHNYTIISMFFQGYAFCVLIKTSLGR